MPPHRANARNANTTKVIATPSTRDQEVSDAEFRNAIKILAKSMTN